MALDENILQLNPAAPLDGTEVVPGVQGGANVKITIQEIVNFANQSTTIYINTTIAGLQALITATSIIAGVRYNVTDATPLPCSVWGVSASVITDYAEQGGSWDGTNYVAGLAGTYDAITGAFLEQGRCYTAPTVNFDAAHGYYVGQRLITLDTGVTYVCIDNTNGAAVWQAQSGD